MLGVIQIVEVSPRHIYRNDAIEPWLSRDNERRRLDATRIGEVM
jgi:hypothetical protein